MGLKSHPSLILRLISASWSSEPTPPHPAPVSPLGPPAAALSTPPLMLVALFGGWGGGGGCDGVLTLLMYVPPRRRAVWAEPLSQQRPLHYRRVNVLCQALATAAAVVITT